MKGFRFTKWIKGFNPSPKDTEYDVHVVKMSKKSIQGLKITPDDGTTYVTVPTPEGWKCERKGCTADYKHSHGMYPSLKNHE